MSNGQRWSKFWWGDWQNDKALRLCSIGARGLWMEMLCIAHEGEPVRASADQRARSYV